MTARRWVVTTLAAVAVLLLAGRLVAGAYAEYLWYDALGATPLWRARLMTLAGWRWATWVVATLYAFAHFYAVRASVASVVLHRRLGNIEIGETVPGRYLTLAALGLSGVLGGLLSLAQSGWVGPSAAFGGAAFGERDPYFGADLGFFVHWLPFESGLWAWSVFVATTVAVAVLALYMITEGLRWRNARPVTSAHTRRHLTVMAGLGLLLLAWYFRLAMYELLLDAPGDLPAFSTLDQRVRIPGQLLLSIAALGTGLFVIWMGVTGQYRLAAGGIVAVLVLWIATAQVAPLVASRGTESADPDARDRPLRATQAGYTRRAFGIDRLPAADTSVAFPSLSEAAPWIALWDEPTLRTLAGTARDTTNLWIGWRAAPDGLRALTVTRDESVALEGTEQWTAVEYSATRAGADGMPLELSRRTLRTPVAYPGANGYAVLDDSGGGGGVALNTLGTRVALAWSLQNPSLLRRGVTSAETVVDHRDVRERVARLAPFFLQDRTVRPAVVGDTVYWMVDLFAASQWYPLGQRIGVGPDEWNYFRHAALAVVNGATGRVTLIAAAMLDPMAATWVHRFGDLFGSWNELPAEIAPARVPSVDGALAQAVAYARFGTTTDGEMGRHLPADDGADTGFVTRVTLQAAPGARAPMLTLPLLGESSDLRGLLTLVGGSEVRTTWSRVPASTPRWTEVLRAARLSDSATIGDRTVVRGAVRVVPGRTRPTFIQPAFDRPHRAMPMLRSVTIIGDSVSQAASLHALDPANREPVAGDLGARVETLYRTMRDALQRGDWVAFGRAFEALGRLTGQGPP